MRRLLALGWNRVWVVHLFTDDRHPGIEIRGRSLAAGGGSFRRFFQGDLAAAQAHVDQSPCGPMQSWIPDLRHPPRGT
jgi:hypothetical protein